MNIIKMKRQKAAKKGIKGQNQTFLLKTFTQKMLPQKEEILRKLHHRFKNSLQFILSPVQLQSSTDYQWASVQFIEVRLS